MIKFELTLNDFYVETLNELVRQFNELLTENDSYSYSSQDVIELLIIREYVNSELKLVRPWKRSIFFFFKSVYFHVVHLKNDYHKTNYKVIKYINSSIFNER